ncbi:MAG: phosphatidylglycerophosphatase A [Elusimicrobiaceae bacterium]|nr:phosphatidylglycerophosphatase A [Elusimicrobiaceae bacterium]
MKQNVLKFFASGAFISYLPTAILKNKKNTGAGFLGSLEAFLIYLFLGPLSFWVYFFLLIGIILFAIYVSQKVEFEGAEDNPKIIIDEIAGFFVAAAFLPCSVQTAILALVLFRIFDTTKLAFIKKTENIAAKLPQEIRKKYYLKGVEIVLDDVLAGICANLILWVLVWGF